MNKPSTSAKQSYYHDTIPPKLDHFSINTASTSKERFDWKRMIIQVFWGTLSLGSSRSLKGLMGRAERDWEVMLLLKKLIRDWIGLSRRYVLWVSLWCQADNQTIPALQRSAISRQQTLIVVPSYFDYVRLTDYLRRPESKISYAAISEYSSNSEISRARTTFFKGKKDFLVVTERFHFYRRYKLRGAKTIVYYSLPDHARFYAEFAQTPFLPSRKNGEETEAEVEVEEVSTRVLFSRFDALKLERVVGSVDARRMLASGEERFVFA
jgi:hypothetical protein